MVERENPKVSGIKRGNPVSLHLPCNFSISTRGPDGHTEGEPKAPSRGLLSPFATSIYMLTLVAAFAAAAAAPYDVIVVGSGLGGLSAGALCSKYGKKVLVCEAHSIPGGCAHSFERSGFTFDSGPSLWSGCANPSYNPLRQVLDAIDEQPTWVQYDGWAMYTESGDFFAVAGDEAKWKATMAELGSGSATVAEWEKLMDFIEPLQRAVLAVPPIALRADPGALLTAGPYLSAMADPRIGLRAYLLSGPWGAVLEAAGVSDPFLLNWFNFLAFAFSGLPSDGTVAAAMIYMLAELHKPGAKMDYPIGGSGAVVDALIRGVEKHGGEVRLRSPVKELCIDESGRCHGVRLSNGELLTATEAVISNAPVWETSSLLPEATRAAVRAELRGKGANAVKPLDENTPATPSFMHLHLGIRGDGLTDEAVRSIHHIAVPEWAALTAPQSAAFVSVPSLLDASLAPDGKHVIHAYLPATEPFEVWEGLDRKGEEYERMKRERAEPLYRAIRRFIPDVDEVQAHCLGVPLSSPPHAHTAQLAYSLPPPSPSPPHPHLPLSSPSRPLHHSASRWS